MGFKIEHAKREKIYVKLALMAPSGGGKTYSGLRLATGMAQEIERSTGKKAKILMANTEQARGRYYANEFEYDIVDVDSPFNPEKFVELIEFAEQEGYDILLLDSSSAEWEGKGGCLELHQKAGGTYQSWAKVTPRHDKFIGAIADSKLHLIATMRGKDQYEMEKDNNGKASVKKLGIGAQQRQGFEYEFTCTFLLDQKTNMAEVQKDNTHIFENEGATLLSESHGEKLIKWANEGKGFTEHKRNNAPNVESLHKQVIDLAKQRGGSKDSAVMDVIKKYADSGNPNSIDDAEQLTALIADLKNLEDK